MSEKGQLGVPLVKLSEEKVGFFDCLFLGLPFDLHTVTQPGARYGSQFLHECQPHFDWHRDGDRLSGMYCHRRRKLLFNNSKIGDLGDLDVSDLTPERVPHFIEEVERYASILAKNSRLPIFIGGDHSLTHLLVRGVKSVREIEYIIQLDAHSDTDAFFNSDRSPLKHNNFISHILSENSQMQVVQIGVRDFSLPPISQEDRLHQFSPDPPELIVPRLAEILEGRSGVSAYLTIDVDVLDPSHFMHVSAPLPGGYNFTDLEVVIECLTRLFKFEALDIMEICPNAAASRQSAMFLNYSIARIVSSVLGE